MPPPANKPVPSPFSMKCQEFVGNRFYVFFRYVPSYKLFFNREKERHQRRYKQNYISLFSFLYTGVSFLFCEERAEEFSCHHVRPFLCVDCGTLSFILCSGAPYHFFYRSLKISHRHSVPIASYCKHSSLHRDRFYIRTRGAIRKYG